LSERILIAGGGIGGLAAALALSRSGFAVSLFEARSDPHEAGAGIQISANGTKALRWLGLEDAVAAHACFPESVDLRLPGSGKTVSRVPLGAFHAARYGARYMHLHRADLYRVLLDAARRQPGVDITLGRRVAEVVQTPGGAEVGLEGGQQIEGEAVIGADGVRSDVREGVAGQDAAHFTGMVAWRAVVPADGLAETPRAHVWMGRGRHLVHYPISGGRQINLVGVVERADWRGESWTEFGTAEEMQADFGGWHPSVDALLRRLEAPFRWALYERKDLSVWSAGRVALLGDACHAMPPFLAQGACMALEDAVVLARLMAAGRDDLTRALREFADVRRPRTAEVARAAWANAWRFHLRSGLLRTCVYGGLSLAGMIAPTRPARLFDWLYSYDPAKPEA
jgi:salicylate hydroxylase